MKHPLFSIIAALVVFNLYGQGQTTKSKASAPPQNDTADRFEFSLKSANPKAKVLMKEDFYWSPIEETAPFGSDDGFDAAYSFREWRLLNKKTSPVVFLNDLIKSWQYPFFDYNEMDTAKIRQFIFSMANPDEATIQQHIQEFKEALKNSPDTTMNKLTDKELRDAVVASSRDMGGDFLLGQDNAIIGTGFAQFVLEGHMDADIRKLTITAIKRQLLPMLINRYDADYQETRKQQLTKMLVVATRAQ